MTPHAGGSRPRGPRRSAAGARAKAGASSPPAAPADAASTYRGVLDHAYELIALAAPDGTLRFANRAALDRAGADVDAVVGLALWDAPWWPADEVVRERLRAGVSEAASGRFVRFDVTAAPKDGSAGVLDISLTPARAADGSVEAIVAEGRDVTDRAAAVERLRISEAKFAGIVSIAADAIITCDAAGRIVLFNEGAQRIFGRAPDEVLGQPLGILIPEPFRAVHRQHMREFDASAVPARRMGHRGEIVGLRKNGEVFPAEASISKLELGGQKLFTAVLRDITDRKRAEEERLVLLAAEQDARAAAEAAQQRSAMLAAASSLLDRSLDFEESLRSLAQFVVPALADACAIDIVVGDRQVRRLEVAVADPALSVIAHTLARYPRDPDRPYFAQTAIAHRRTGWVRDLTEVQVRAMAQDEEHFAAMWALRPTSYVTVPLVARDRTLGAITLLRTPPSAPYEMEDVAFAEELGHRASLSIDNARLYGAARQAVQARDDVLSVVSHDLRNPLSAIQMCASTLTEPEVPLDSVRDLAETIQRSTEWMNRIIQDLLDVASIEAGKLSLRRQWEDVGEVLAAGRELLEPLAEERSVALETSVPAGLPRVSVDADRVLQVLSNLVGNACKFTEAGGRVEVLAEPRDGEVVIAVRDTGSGIAPEELPHIFDRFWHAQKNSRKRGTGLGLAIAKGIVEAHGGRIWAESRPGAGSTFYFALPAGARTGAPAAAPARAEPSPRG